MLSVDIYGSLIYTADNPLETLIEGWGRERHEQIWRRRELPSFFNNVEYDKDDNAILTPQQEQFAREEVIKCKEGYWFFNNGVPTYITGKHYFYLNWWKLEDDIYPEYRDTDRRYFLFLNHWENVLWCLGIFRGKKRREGASSQATSNLVYECIFFTNSNCGLVSKTQIDSRDTFTDMVRHGYTQCPIFLKPRQLNRADSVTELVFAARLKNGEAVDGGQKSKINYRAPVLNAYDRGRMTRILADEGGKWPTEVDFAKFISIVSKTMVKGAKRVGFCEAPSTVNEMTKGGGAAFKKAWDGANQFKYPNRPTPNRFVTYFSPAYDGYEGFIDRHGMSVIGEPTHEQFQYLVDKWVKKDPITGIVVSELTEEDIKMGARQYVMVKRREGLTGDLLEEEIRMNPCTVEEMFEAANIGCVFNSYNITKREKVLEENPIYKRKVIFYRDLDGVVKWRDIQESEKNFHWSITAFPPKGQENKYRFENKLRYPGRTEIGAIAVDGYSNSQGGRKYGSKASAWIGLRPDILDPYNTGKAIGHLYGRPAVKETLHEQVMLAAEYFGFKVWYEHNSDDYLSYFRDRGKVGYLGTYPLSTIDPTKRADADRFKGFPTTPFSLTKQLDCGIAYFEHYCDLIDFEELLQNAKLFDPYNRTAYDTVVSFLMLLVCLMEPIRKPKPPTEPLVRSYINTYGNQNFLGN
jgi:hypothetical protein